jgi:hypothetical protein
LTASALSSGGGQRLQADALQVAQHVVWHQRLRLVGDAASKSQDETDQRNDRTAL